MMHCFRLGMNIMVYYTISVSLYQGRRVYVYSLTTLTALPQQLLKKKVRFIDHHSIIHILGQSTTSEPLSNHQSTSLSSSAPPVSPRGANSPSAMRIHSSPSVPRGVLNNFSNF